jgi:lipoprotein LprG
MSATRTRTPVLTRARALAVVLSAALALAGCSGDGGSTDDLPDGTKLVADAATEMRAVASARFTVRAEGTIAGLPLRGAEGQLTRDGDAQGSVRLDQGGSLVEIAFVLTGQTAYIKGATGGFQRVPRAVAATVYDPSAILDPDRGVARLLATAKDARTEGKETIDGRDTYQVKATLDKEALATLVPGASQEAVGTLWIDTGRPRLTRTRIPVRGTGGDAGGTVTVTISDTDTPVTITPPAG